jgi:hypothetical protein
VEGIWEQHQVADSSELKFDPLSLSVSDKDLEEDLDLVVGEHTPLTEDGHLCRLFIFENVDKTATRCKKHLVFSGNEHHQGAFIVDIDRDGDK